MSDNQEDPTEFQKRLARIGVWSNACIGFGGIASGIGGSMLFTTFSLSGTQNLVNLFNAMGFFSFALGLFFIMLGLLYPMYILRKKSEKKELDHVVQQVEKLRSDQIPSDATIHPDGKVVDRKGTILGYKFD